jgi:GT2 family glycosyltransferase
MPENPQISVIIPTLRAEADLVAALESLASDEEAPPHEVLVVLNTIRPQDIDFAAHHPNCRPIQADTNLGFAAACDTGAREASGETLAFLNDDATVRPGWLRALLSALESTEYPAVGGMILTEDGKKVDFAGGSINLLGWGFQLGHGEKFQKEEFVVPKRTPFACGGNFAIRTEVFLAAGGFDEDYFAFYEDVDLGWRLGLLGHQMGYVPEAVVFHKGGATGAAIPSSLKWFLQERNALQTIIKNYSDEILRQVLPIAFALVGVRAQVLSGLEISDIAPDRTWREWILGEQRPIEAKESGVWRGMLDSVKESLKAGMKEARKASLPEGYLAIESRGAAGPAALEWCLGNWENLMDKRQLVQAFRVKSDYEVLPLFDDPLRPVLGHPREVEAMKPLESILSVMMKGQ